MTEHLMLLAPSGNRVYAADAPRLAAAELRALTVGFGLAEPDVLTTCIAGVDYLSLRTGDELTSWEVRVLSQLSAAYALYRREGDLLAPVALQHPDRYPSDLVTIQKYQGKTNEQWTRLLLNVTAAATATPDRLLDGTLRVLDPMCGRGTTLNIALSLGLDVTGVDLDSKDFQAYSAFIKTWMRQHRLKHSADESSLRTDGRGRGRQLRIEVAASKDDHKAGRTQRVIYLSTDTTDLDGLIRPRSVDVIVTDTPYGVQHGSHGDRLARSPLDLLDRALPEWVRTLRTGGAVGLSYNRHVAPRDELAALLVTHGLTLVDGDPDAFRHRVDASIDRDLLVARKGR
ncbi:TRM11 family SAM-dependent methyltransferase [Flexivirga caeni]|uniref:SAM-dependent methyltransferase n=1 Tax=Flexivirga caeni TaxID=2294115 RepID=A0A3M9MBU7_9MICO|nr:SAM-dependent methyltransferase [Flexivirga caeni]RNI23050.1 SAM-dependent methyltransferase [Flexivirga caeni]